MKKLFSLIVFALLINQFIFAQAPIPNPSFENWTSGEPDSWGTSDGVLVSFGQPDPGTAERDMVPANVYSGTSSVRLTNKHVTTPFGDQDIPGVVSLGSIGFDITSFSPTITGYAYTDRPDSIHFAAKYLTGVNGTDTGNVAVTLTKWTPNGQIIIARTVVRVTDNASFTEFTEKIVYHSVQAPDTLLVQAIATSSQTMVLEAQMWVDDFSFIGLDTAFAAYINPSFDLAVCEGDTVHFRTDPSPNNTYQWYRNGQPIGGAMQPGIDPVADGTYYLEVTAAGTVYTSDSVQVFVNPLPTVSYTVDAAQDTLCKTSGSIALTGGSPVNGVYSGSAVTNDHFNPASAATGSRWSGTETSVDTRRTRGCASVHRGASSWRL